MCGGSGLGRDGLGDVYFDFIRGWVERCGSICKYHLHSMHVWVLLSY